MLVVLTLVETKQIKMNSHKRNNKINTVQTIQNTVKRSTHSKYNIRFVTSLSMIYNLIKKFFFT